jgi:hypothetical protein
MRSCQKMSLLGRFDESPYLLYDLSTDCFFQEFAQLTAENVVFKLMGPVLVKQDQGEARSNVETRLDFIRSEMLA